MASDATGARPLEGIRVLDLTTSVAGPWCTLILAALGAEVVKIEHPYRGDDTRTWGPPFWDGESTTFLGLNADKRSVAIDLKTDGGRELVGRLASASDVVVQNLRPGLVDRLGLGFEQLRERNPSIVYCSIGAYGREGPKRSQPGYDPLMQAAGGLMSITGEPGRPPVRSGVSVIDQGTGMWAAIAVLGALRLRDADGQARLVDTSLYETALSWISYQLVGHLGTGEVPGPQGSGAAMVAPYQTFDARDRSLMVAAPNDRQFRSLCTALDVPELAGEERFASNPARVAHRDELARRLTERFATRDAADWLERLDTAGVPAAPVRDFAEVVSDAQTVALGMLQSLPHPDVPELEVVAPPLSLDGERLRFGAPPPRLGEHTAQVLAELGYTGEEVARLVDEGVIVSRQEVTR